MIRRMKAFGFASFAILLIVNSPVFAQAKGARSDGRQVTVTLVRWPYT